MTEKSKMEKLIDKYGGELQKKLQDPVFFINEIIGFDKKPYKLTPYQGEWLRLMEDEDRLNLMAFRSSGKSEVLLIDYPIFKAFTIPKWQGIIVSNSLKQSTSLMRRIREKILQSEILRTSVPDTRDSSWSKTEIQLKNMSMMWSRPNNENLPGEHVDWIGGDEIGYWKDMNIITKVIPPMVRAKSGKIVYIGTPTSEVDAIHQLQKNQAYISKVYPANLRVTIDEVSKSLWEMRYPDIPIQKARREYDSLSWSREFLCKPLSAADQIFPFELVAKSFDKDASFTKERFGHNAYYMGCDFALSGEVASDFTVITILEKSGDQVRLVRMERYRGLSYQAQKLRIQELSAAYKPVKVVVDEGTFGKSFMQDLVSEKVPVEGFRFTNESKQNVITNLRNFFEQEKIIISYDETHQRTKEMIDILVKELQKFGVSYTPLGGIKFEGLGEHDDMVISLALACWGARGIGKMSWKVERGGGKSKSSIIYLGKVN